MCILTQIQNKPEKSTRTNTIPKQPMTTICHITKISYYDQGKTMYKTIILDCQNAPAIISCDGCIVLKECNSPKDKPSKNEETFFRTTNTIIGI